MRLSWLSKTASNLLTNSEEIKSSLIWVILGIVTLVAGTMPPVAAEEVRIPIHDAELVETVDRDEDGFVRSFTIEITADVDVNERGELTRRGRRGHPSFVILFETPEGTVDSAMYRQPGRGDEVKTFTMSYSREDMESLMEEKRNCDPEKYWEIEELRGVANGKLRIDALRLLYLESDGTHERDIDRRFKCQWLWSSREEQVASAEIPLDEPLRLEPAERDTVVEVIVNSDPQGATLFVGAERKGVTPWAGLLPMAAGENAGTLLVRLTKEGYEPLEKIIKVEDSTELELSLTEETRKLALDSSPQGATVRIDGEKIGKTPVSTELQTNEEVDVRIEMEGYETAHLSDVTAPLEETIELEPTAERKEEAARRLAETAKATAAARMPGEELTAPAPPTPKATPEPDLSEIPPERREPESADLRGVWHTNRGTLHLRQFDGYVVGDYADKGILFGRVEGDCVAGVFTDEARSGVFRARVGRGSLEGSWSRGKDLVPGDSWDGVRTSSDAPRELSNFTRDETSVMLTQPSVPTLAPGTPGTSTAVVERAAEGSGSAANVSSEITASYESDLGPVDLVATPPFLIGDLGDQGALAGVWDGESYVGQVTLGERAGWFDVRFSDDGRFEGGRITIPGIDGAPQQAPGGTPSPDRFPGSKWALDRVEAGEPQLENLGARVSCSAL